MFGCLRCLCKCYASRKSKRIRRLLTVAEREAAMGCERETESFMRQSSWIVRVAEEYAR